MFLKNLSVCAHFDMWSELILYMTLAYGERKGHGSTW